MRTTVDVESIKARADILRVIGSVVVLTQKSGKWWGLCPFHQEKTASFTVDPEKGFYKCFGCGEGGDVISFVEKQYHVSFAEACEILGGTRATATTAPYENPRLHKGDPCIEAAPALTTPDDVAAALAGLAPYPDTPAAAYLTGRGIVPLLPLLCGVQYAARWPVIGAAVVFPAHGPLIGDTRPLMALQARALSPIDKSRKERSRGAAGSGVFFTLRALELPLVMIAEAPIDALSLALCGYPAVATFGTPQYPAWLASECHGVRVVLAQDADESGDKAAEKWWDIMATVGIRCERLRPRGVKDWNEYLQRAGLAQMREDLDQVIGDW